MIGLRAFGTITVFVMLGPPAGYVALTILIAHGSSLYGSKAFENPFIYIALFFSYMIGVIPALMCGLLVCISDQIIGKPLLRIGTSTIIGGLIGFLMLFSMDIAAHHYVSDIMLDLDAGFVCAFAALCCSCPLAFVAVR